MKVIKRPLQISFWSGLFLSALSGCLMIAGYPPFKFWGLHLFCLAPLFLALQAASNKHLIALYVFICGLVFLGAGYSWMTRFSEWSGAVSYFFWAFLTLYQASFFLLFGALFAATRRLAGPVNALLLSPLLWVAGEHLASYGPFGIPEWIGHGQLQDRLLHPVAATLGVNGVSFAVVLVSLIPALIIHERKLARPFWVTIACLAVLVLGSKFGSLLNNEPKKELSLDVALLQPRIDPGVLNDGSRGQDVLSAYIDETRALLQEGKPLPDLVFWSEMVFPYSFNDMGPTRQKMAEALSGYSGELVFGGPEKSDGNYFNAAYLVSGDEIRGVYRKVRLFPFGEYTPLRGLLSFLRKDLPLKLRARDYSFGTDDHPLNTRKASIGLSICFESVYTDFIRKEVEGGAQLLANLTNDGWFAGSAVDEHHLYVGSMRAVENGRYFLQIASSGISAIVDPEGHVVMRSAQLTTSTLRATVPLLTTRTLFTRLGYGRFAVLALLTLLLVAVSRPRSPVS